MNHLKFSNSKQNVPMLADIVNLYFKTGVFRDSLKIAKKSFFLTPKTKNEKKYFFSKQQ